MVPRVSMKTWSPMGTEKLAIGMPACTSREATA